MKNSNASTGHGTYALRENKKSTMASRTSDTVCPDCNGSLYITCFTIDGVKIIGCPYCKGSGKKESAF